MKELALKSEESPLNNGWQSAGFGIKGDERRDYRVA